MRERLGVPSDVRQTSAQYTKFTKFMACGTVQTHITRKTNMSTGPTSKQKGYVQIFFPGPEQIRCERKVHHALFIGTKINGWS